MSQEIKVGDKVRSYDFPEGIDDCYREGVVIGFSNLEDYPRYTIKVSKSVWEGVEDAKFPGIVYAPVNGTPTTFGRVTHGVEKI